MSGEFKVTCKCRYCVGVRDGRKEGARQELEKLLKEAWFVTGEGMNKISGDDLHKYILERLKELGA